MTTSLTRACRRLADRLARWLDARAEARRADEAWIARLRYLNAQARWDS